MEIAQDFMGDSKINRFVMITFRFMTVLLADTFAKEYHSGEERGGGENLSFLNI